MEPHKIILVDDHSLFRNGLRGLLERCAACRVVGEAASGEEFLAMLGGIDADVVFMDFAMPGLDGAQTTERALAQRPDLKSSRSRCSARRVTIRAWSKPGRGAFC